jgi:RNA polymerase sigma-70 factor (ECF subfamily)
MSSGSVARFPTTAWSVVRLAQKKEGGEFLAAMNRCIAGYWRPVFYFLRVKEYPFHDAEDLTQEFFLEFFRRDWIRRADPQRGRFRTFLLTLLVRFLSDRGPKRSPRQALFDRQMVSVSALLTDEDRTFEPRDNDTPEGVFFRQWAAAVIANARKALEAWCCDKGRPDWYEIFSAKHSLPAGKHRESQEALGERMHLSRDQIRYGLEQADRQFRELLRGEVADQVGCEAEIDEEIRELRRLLSD